MKSVSMKQRLAGKKSLKKQWMQKESVSKQGRKPAKAEPTVHKDPAFDDLDDDAMDYIETEDAQDEGRTSSVVLEEKESADKEVSTEVPVSTVKPNKGTDKRNEGTDKQDGSTDSTKVSTDRQDEGTADQNKEKSATQTAPTTTSTPTPTIFSDDETIAQIDPKDKGKKVLEEEAESDAESEGVNEAERKFDQLAKDEEISRKVQEDCEVEEEVKKLVEEEATKVALTNEYDFIHARINADKILAKELQKEEREKFTIEQRAKFLHDTIAAQRKFLAQQMSEAMRNKPPTRNQLRNQMMTYLKHDGGKKHSDLKTKTFEEIQVLYERLKRQDQNFVFIGSDEDARQIKEINEESKDPEKKRLKKRVVNEEDTAKVPAEQEVTEQGTKKRKSGHVKMIARKRPRPQPNDDSDDEHRKCLRIITFESTIDSEIMETKSFIARLHKVSSPDGNYLFVYRVNGHFRALNYLMEHSEITPEDIELILWGDLKIMMESSTEENDQGDFWNNQQEWEIVRWRLYEACGVCILELKDGTVIYMLVERRYPLSKELLQQMLDLGLEVEEESTVALQLNYLKEQTLCKLKVKIYSVKRSNNNFIGRIKGTHVFIGNFTYIVDFMIVEDISSIIDPRLSQVKLGKPFVEISNMTHDSPEGVVRFTNGIDEIANKMPHMIEQYNSLSDLEKEHTKSVYLRNEEDKRRGVKYVMSKILRFYKEFLKLGSEYVTGIDDEGEVVLYLMRKSLEVLRKFHWMILGGQFNQLSHVSSPLLSKPGEY
ncbi:hypothetical protein Tco_1218929 [Tanacetum coccineum]